MKISLRKAHDIQNRLQARVNEILGECENDVDVLHEEQPHIVLNLARDRNLARMNRVDVMINELRDIRMSVSRLNQMVGINDLLEPSPLKSGKPHIVAESDGLDRVKVKGTLMPV